VLCATVRFEGRLKYKVDLVQGLENVTGDDLKAVRAASRARVGGRRIVFRNAEGRQLAVS